MIRKPDPMEQEEVFTSLRANSEGPDSDLTFTKG